MLAASVLRMCVYTGCIQAVLSVGHLHFGSSQSLTQNQCVYFDKSGKIHFRRVRQKTEKRFLLTHRVMVKDLTTTIAMVVKTL